MAAEAEQGRREWSREDWVAYADRLLDVARRHAVRVEDDAVEVVWADGVRSLHRL